MELRTRTKLACQIAGIDPLRLNEAVFNGNFLCAPETEAGRARVFKVDDIVALRVFGDSIRVGYTTAAAGKLACRVLAMMRENPAAEWVTITRGLGEFRAVTAGEFLPEDQFVKPVTVKFYQDAINVKELRKFVIEQLEEERTIVGGED